MKLIKLQNCHNIYLGLSPVMPIRTSQHSFFFMIIALIFLKMHYDSHLTKKFKKSAVCFHDTKIITIFTIKGFPVKGKYIKIYLPVHAFEILYFL